MFPKSLHVNDVFVSGSLKMHMTCEEGHLVA